MKKSFQLIFFLLSLTVNAQVINSNTSNRLSFGFFDRNLSSTNVSVKVNMARMSVPYLSKTINITIAGTLDNALTSSEKNSITDLIVSGTINAHDFKIMRDSMLNLSTLDLSAVTIAAYSGSEGTSKSSYSSYQANEIPSYAFYKIADAPGLVKNQIKSIVLPNALTSIGDVAFAFSSLTSISISASIKNIGFVAFSGCDAQINVDAANPYYSSVNGVLYNKSQSKLIQCPTSVSGVFTLPLKVDSIGIYAFFFCDKLSAINLSSSILSIGDFAFTSCSGLMNVDAPNSHYVSQDGVLYNKSKTKLIQCPTSVLGTFVIPTSVDSLNNNSFYNCNLLTAISLPSSVNYIGNYSFYNCSSLSAITVNSLPVSLSSSYNVFSGVNLGSCVLNVPFGTKASYQLSDYWNVFSTIIENAHGIILNKKSLVLSANSGINKIVSIQSNDSWVTSSDQSWLKVLPTSGSGNDSLTFTVESNPLTTTRSALVTVTVTGVEPQTVCVRQIGQPKELNITSGSLSSVLDSNELSTTMSLKLTGTIDARDFKTMRDQMSLLANLDLSGASITAYTGSEGTAGNSTLYYAPSKIPQYAFNQNNYSARNDVLQVVILPSSLTAIGSSAFASCRELQNVQIPTQVNTIENSAFNYCTKLKNIVLPIALTKIENNVFSYSGLQSVSIPTNVQTIDYSAFGNCSGLYSVTISNSVTTIGDYAFQNCIELTDLLIGNGVTSLGRSAFGNCTKLVTVNLPNSVTLLNDGVFSYCSNLTNVTLSNSLTSIVSKTFLNCTKLNNLVIPLSVSKLESSCFANCQGLTEIIIPNNVVSIGSSAFESCTGLTKISFGSSLTSLELYSFKNCTALTSISIPASVTSIGTSAFESCSGLSSINVENEIPLNLYSVYNVFNNVNLNTCVLHIPYGTSLLYSVASPWRYFKNIVENLGFKLEQNTQSIGSANGSMALLNISSNEVWNATSDQNWLKVNTTSGSGITPILITAEANPSSTSARTAKVTITANGVLLKYITISQGVSPKLIKSDAGSLKYILTPDELLNVVDLSVTGKIDARDFLTLRDLMPKLRYLDLTGTRILAYTGTEGTESSYSSCEYDANAVPKYAFHNFYKSSGNRTIVTIKLPAGTRSIGREAFNACSALTEVIIPDSTKLIDMYAFEYCTALNNIVIPNSVTSLGDNVFQNCSRLISLTLSDSLTNLVWDTFQNCTNLTNIKMGKLISNIGSGTFQNCSSLINVTIPNSVISIGSFGFSNCSSLNNVGIGNSVISIGSYAFSTCKSLTNINIPMSVLSIGGSAFSGCSVLKSISTEATIPVNLSKSSDVFLNVDKVTCVLTVPYKTKNRYSVANQWKDFVNIVESSVGLILETDTARLASKAGNSTLLIVTANTTWSITSNDPWIHLNTLSGSGSGSIILSADQNFSFLPRKSSFTISIDGAPTQVISVIQEGSRKEVTTTAGKLFSQFNTKEKNNLLNLSISGTLDARDFKFMRDSLSLLTNLDLSAVTVEGYVGSLGCDTLKNAIYLPNVIPQYSFCNDLTKIFNINLQSIVLPESIISIGRAAFAECGKLTQVNIPKFVKTIDRSAFFDCISLTVILIPNSVNTIGINAFYGCNQLNGVKIPESVTSLGNYAFGDCYKLTSINIPASIGSIGSKAFSYCFKLNSIYVYPMMPIDLSLSLDVFKSIDMATCTLYVPKGSKTLYQNAFQWKDFTNIVEMGPTDESSLLDLKLSVYPNPAKFGFRIMGLPEMGQLTMYDLAGRVILSKKVVNDEYISTENLIKGLYILRIKTTEIIVDKKLLVE